MKKNNYNVIAIMSETPLDSVDFGHIKFRLNNKKLALYTLEREIINQSQSWINALKSAVDYS